jgi:hypothetical protein
MNTDEQNKPLNQPLIFTNEKPLIVGTLIKSSAEISVPAISGN